MKKSPTENAQQVIIHPVPGGNIIIHRYGLIFQVFVDTKKEMVTLSPEWIQRHYFQLRQISSAASRTLTGSGLEVLAYG